MSSVPDRDSYCVKDKRVTGSTGSTLSRTRNGRYIVKSRCVNCGITKTRFVSRQEGEGLLSMLGIKTPLSKIPIIGSILG